MEIGKFDPWQFWWGLEPSFTPWWFFVLLAFALLWYYALPKRGRWVVLLIASLAFCAVGGWQTVASIVLVTCIAWSAGLSIEATQKEEKVRRKLLLSCTCIVLVVALAYVKLNALWKWSTAWFVVPIGLSYYTLSVISYLVDVYRGRQEAERNPLHMLLFVAWFPKIIEGPIERYGKLAPQLIEGHQFEWVGFCHGMQLALWGYIKKMVIADRIAVLTTQAFEHHTLYGGLVMLLAAVLAAVQLYCDFSGCMDIAGGVSQMFGIRLEANFRQPFFSRSAAEFWRRWHITLGTWFKDYVYMPLTVSRPVMAAAKWARAHVGRMASRRVMQVIPLVVVWLLTGLWHGTGANYLVWGAWWGVIIICDVLFSKAYAGLAAHLHVDTSSGAWHAFQAVRTFMFFVIGRIITIPGNLAVTGQILLGVVADPRPWQLVDGTLLGMGLDATNLNLMVLFIGLVWAVDLLHERGVGIRAAIGSWPMPVREIVYVAGVMAVLVFGMYGPAYNASAFVYMQY